MTRESLVTIVDREGAMSELRRLAKLLWAVHDRGAASPEDMECVYDILVGLHASARHHVTPRDMIESVYAVTCDLEFSLNTVRILFPDMVAECSRAALQ